MNTSDRFVRFAGECEVMAKFSRTPENRAVWSGLAERWICCAKLMDHRDSEDRSRRFFKRHLKAVHTVRHKLSQARSGTSKLTPFRSRAHPSVAQVVSEVPRDDRESALQDRIALLAALRSALESHARRQLFRTELNDFPARNSLGRSSPRSAVVARNCLSTYCNHARSPMVPVNFGNGAAWSGSRHN